MNDNSIIGTHQASFCGYLIDISLIVLVILWRSAIIIADMQNSESTPKVAIDLTTPSIRIEGASVCVVVHRDGRIILHKGHIERATPYVRASRPAYRTGEAVLSGPDKGWIFCVQHSGEPFLAAPADLAPLDWNEARERALRESARVPGKDQIRALAKARHTGRLKGTFNTVGDTPEVRYWCDVSHPSPYAWARMFNAEGHWTLLDRTELASLRLVRPFVPS